MRSSPASVKATSGRPWRGGAPRRAIASASAAVGLEEFQPRRRGVEQIAHLDARCRAPSAAGFTARTSRRRRPRVVQACGSPAVPRGDGEPRHRADRGQRLAAKAERARCRSRSSPGELGGGVALDRERQIVARHAGAVVGDADQPCGRRRRSATSMRRAPASSAFSTSSLTALAGRSTTSPAAMRLTIDFGQLADGHRRPDFDFAPTLSAQSGGREAERHPTPAIQAPSGRCAGF